MVRSIESTLGDTARSCSWVPSCSASCYFPAPVAWLPWCGSDSIFFWGHEPVCGSWFIRDEDGRSGEPLGVGRSGQRCWALCSFGPIWNPSSPRLPVNGCPQASSMQCRCSSSYLSCWRPPYSGVRRGQFWVPMGRVRNHPAMNLPGWLFERGGE